MLVFDCRLWCSTWCPALRTSAWEGHEVKGEAESYGAEIVQPHVEPPRSIHLGVLNDEET